MASHQERWQLAGTAADIYQQHLAPAIFGPWAPVLVDLAAPRAGDRVLDVACGTGRPLRPHGNGGGVASGARADGKDALRELSAVRQAIQVGLPGLRAGPQLQHGHG